ncbi:glycosyltransferase family 2 protein [Pseudohaliea sp.]|uniref:glycosyltransferase family 2 protein n=1 Tax=Pseudohaliea sp. TaxID=2740289 RepID=UPI0032ECDE5E
MRLPLVSVVLPSYNRADSLPNALRSIAEQDYGNLEIILVDDGSSDDTGEKVAQLAIPELRYLRHEKNRGANAARNTGIAAANGEFIAFQDSDDTWDSRKLSLQIRALQAHGGHVAFCAFDRIIDGKRVRIPKPGYQIRPGCEDRFGRLLEGSFISCQSLIVRKALLLEAGLFDEALPRLQDWELCLRLAKRHPMVYLEDALVQVDISNDSITREVSRLIKAAYIILEKHAEDFHRHPRAAAMLCTNVAIEALKHRRLPSSLRLLARALAYGGVHYPAALRALYLRR